MNSSFSFWPGNGPEQITQVIQPMHGPALPIRNTSLFLLFVYLLTADHSLKPLGCFYILRLLKKITTLFCSLCTGHLIVNLTEYFFLYITTCLLFLPSLTNTFLPTSCQIPSFITTFFLNIGSLT